MADLKPYYDNVLKAQADLQVVVNKIDAAMQLGTAEGADQALGMEAELDAAQSKVEAAEQFYAKMTSATQSRNVARDFVPVSDTETDPEAENAPKGTMVRNEYDALDLVARAEFIKAGGKVVDA